MLGAGERRARDATSKLRSDVNPEFRRERPGTSVGAPSKIL
jgi:hypothetical protein